MNGGPARRRPSLDVAIVTAWVAAILAGCTAGSGHHDRSFRLAGDRREDLSWLEGKADFLFPRERYFTGLGTCGPEVREPDRMDCAIHRALGQAVAMVRQHVRVEVHRHTELERRAGEGGSEARVRSTYRNDGVGYSELTVDDVAPRRRICTADGRCHALVALDRTVLAARSLGKIARLQAQVGELLDGSEKSDAIMAIEQLSAASRLVASIDREAELLAAAAGPSAVPPSVWHRLSRARSKRLESLALCMSSSLLDPPAELVFARAHQDLSARGFVRVAIAKEPDCPERSISVTFDGAIRERVAEYQLWVFEVHGMVVLRSGVRTLGKGVPVLGRGVARLREQARSEAADDLATNVQESLARLLDPTEASAP